MFKIYKINNENNKYYHTGRTAIKSNRKSYKQRQDRQT